MTLKAALVKSEERFLAFKKTLEDFGVELIVLDFSDHQWIEYDYSNVDFLIYYPSFKFTSNYPLALYEVHDNLKYIRSLYPKMKMYPDPEIIDYYNDKYKQYLFLKKANFPIPLTFPLFSEASVRLASRKLGYPIVVKNRYGAGGGSVYKVRTEKELWKFYKLSTFNLFNIDSLRFLGGLVNKRAFYYQLIKRKKMPYPFLSTPLLAQEFVKMDRDLKTVVGNYKVIEAHWRIQANRAQWKVNIDGGGIGEWSRIPEGAIDLSEKLARDLKASWINVDIIPSDGGYLITEFSPVWHHYAYKEKPSFLYKDDYNIDMPLKISLDLERIIVESLMRAVKASGCECSGEKVREGREGLPV